MIFVKVPEINKLFSKKDRLEWLRLKRIEVDAIRERVDFEKKVKERLLGDFVKEHFQENRLNIK